MKIKEYKKILMKMKEYKKILKIYEKIEIMKTKKSRFIH